MGYFVVDTAILLALLIVWCLGYFLRKDPDNPETDAKPMSLALRRIVLGYLLLLGALLVALLIDLNMVDFPESAVSIPITPPPPAATPTPAQTPSTGNTGNTPKTTSTQNPSTPAPPANSGQNTSPAGNSGNASNPASTQNSSNSASGAGASGQNTPPAKPASTDPFILQVIPRMTTSGTTPTTYLAVYGRNLDKAAIRFNGQERPTSHIGDTLLEAQPELADVSGKGSITVDVITQAEPPAERKISNAIIVAIAKPSAPLDLGWWTPDISRETQLLLIALLAGALGCLLHALRSISVFIGNRTAIASWFWWYITRPLLGMSLALIFYAVLRGGFLAGTPADAKVVSPFGVLAMGALVGMFSDKASEKLAEIFATLFQPKSADTRKDQLAAPTASKLQPDTVKVGSAPVVLTITGDHLEKIAKVKFDQQARDVKSSGAQQVTVSLQAGDVAAIHDFTLTLVDSDNKTYPAPTLHVVASDIGG